MKVMAWDQSTTVSAWSIFNDGEYADCGVIDLSSMKNPEERVKKMGAALCKTIGEQKPSMIFIEDVQQQSNPATMKLLARIQGIIIGYAIAHGTEIHIISPSTWRSKLNFKLGSGVKRAELKKQAIDYVKRHYGLTLTEDQCEAVCINAAAHKIYNCEDDI
jgi:Holliday junction resolvasome RuvABC endonuclease subunit